MDVLKKQSRIRAIHAACRAQGIDDDLRKEIQQQVTGKASLKDMSALDLSDLLDHLNKRGKAADGDEWRFVFSLIPARQAHAKKIYRLAQRLGKLQTPPIEIATKAYIEGITEQMRGTDQPLQFCDVEQLHKVVQALEIYLRRHGG